MVFSSTVFLFLFLPAVWILHTAIPGKFIKAKNVLLAAGSFVFYAYGEPVYIFLMAASVVLNYTLARMMTGKGNVSRRVIIGIAVTFDLGVLAFFKYVPWLVSLVDSALNVSLPVPDVALPIGISFYTFQILSYVIDVYKGKTDAQRNFFSLFLYISFFPQLIAGPIVKYGEISDQIEKRSVTAQKTARGIRRFIFGLSKKVLVSNTAAVIADAAFSAASPSTALCWAGALSYSLQIYFDFSGYSDMAVGLASMFGFSLPENFNYPYSAVSIRDFWRRWHISLTSWFREYVYFPLGGNRISGARTVLNRYAVFFLTGLWHGANFTYIFWGLWHGTLMMIEKLAHFEKWTRKAILKPIFHIYTLLAVCLGFVVFRSNTIAAAFSFIFRMFEFSGGVVDVAGYFSPYACIILIVGIIFSCPVLRTISIRANNAGYGGIVQTLGYIACIPLFALCIMTLAASSFNPFIYYIF